MSLLSVSRPTSFEATVACIHCGTPFEVSSRESEFCCAGCRYVHALIHEQGLDRYYELKEKSGVPVGGGVFENRDLDWAEAQIHQAEMKGGRHASLMLHLQGVSCVGCVWLVERVASDFPGVLKARVAAEEGGLQLVWVPGACNVKGLLRELESFGYRFYEVNVREGHKDRDLVLRLGICAALALNAMLFAVPRYFGLEAGTWMENLFGWISFLIASLSMVAGGSYFLVRSWQALRKGILHLDVPIALGLVLAYAGSVSAWIFHFDKAIYFDFVSIFSFLMLAGRWLQNRTVSSNQEKVRESVEFRRVTRLDDKAQKETVREVSLEEVSVGDRIKVEPGRIIPLAGLLESSEARLSLEWINGESEPRRVLTGYPVLSGSYNTGNAAVILKVSQPWQGSLLQRLVRETAEERPRNTALERYIRGYLQVILILALLSGASWLSISGDVWRSLQVVISLLVVSCPCAIGVALPLADELAAARLRARGVFIKAADCWFRLCQVRRIFFDKTGTLSLEGLRLKNPDCLNSLDKESREALWFMVDRSLHPASRCLRAAWLERWLHPPVPVPEDTVVEILGKGVELRCGRNTWRLGRASWVSPGDNGTATLLGYNGKRIVAFEMEEQIRSDAVREFRALARKGYELSILSGDHPGKVAAMAEYLGLREDQALAGCSPDDKAEWVRRWDRKDSLMVGDGANDSLAFGSAWCRATPVVENGVLSAKADFYFTGQSLAGIRFALETAEQRRLSVFRTQLFTISYNAIVVVISMAGMMNPLMAAVLMPCSSVISLAIVGWCFRGSFR